MRYANPNMFGQHDYVHPAVAHEMLLDVAIPALMLALLPWAEPQQRSLALLFVGLYGAGRLALSAFRLDPIWVG